ncbi:MAG: S8 family serine peptidase [Bacteroidales bacterium]|jgi:subtilisin family serine protease|nr:S8 family serine peptidase [Bacteroidales bacterium]
MKRYLLLIVLVLCFYQCSKELEPMYNADSGTIGAKDLFVEGNENRYDIDPEVITVKLKPGVNKIGEDLKEIRSNELGYIDLSVPEDITVEKFHSMLQERGEFETVEFNTIGEYYFMSNDTRRNEQWYLGSINVYSTWDINTGSTNVKVAILDSGTDWSHPDLGVGTDGYSNINASLGWNYATNNSNVITTNYHGTMVAGIVGAKTHNSRGISGVAGGKGSAGITMIPYCVGINAPNAAVLDDAIIDAANKGARVIQMSLGVGSTSAINAAITYAKNRNVVLVCASGNDWSSTVDYPASHQDVIAVGAVDQNGNRAGFSNYGSALDVVAPGVNILSTTLNGDYYSDSGTSFAAPQVSGIAALMLSVNSNLTRQQVTDAIINTANLYPSRNNEYGYGLVNASAAVNSIAPYISGSSNIYFSGNSETYYLYNIPPGTVTWSVSGPFTLSSTSSSTTRVTLTSSSGSGTLTAKVNGTVVATKPIGGSSPSLGPVTGPDAVYKGSTYVSFQLMPRTYPGLKYEWSAGTLVSASSNTSSSEGLFNVPSNTNEDYDMIYCTVSVNGNHIGTYSKSVYIY